MQSSMLRAIVEDFGNGGTIDGDLTISGDLTVSGGGSLSFDEILEGTQVIDITSTEAFLVRKNSDGGDVFVVDTTNSRVGIGVADPDSILEINSADDVTTTALKVLALDDGGYTGTVMEVYGTRGPNSAYNIAKFGTNAGAGVKMVIRGDGNVGIGVTAPVNTLHVSHAAADADNGIMIVNEATTVGAGDFLGGIGFVSSLGISNCNIVPDPAAPLVPTESEYFAPNISSVSGVLCVSDERVSWISILDEGTAVPIPTLPDESIVILAAAPVANVNASEPCE